jgi:transcriptional regulator with XRE-family HTH domain
MTKDERDKVLETFLDSKSHRDVGANIADWSDEDRADFASLIEVADLMWEAGHGAPPLNADPVAAMLGLIPDPHIGLDSGALSRARKNAKLKPSDIAERLHARGWDVGARDVFRWENQTQSDVGPALIRAIAEVIGVRPEQLTTDRGSSAEREAFSSIFNSRRFQALVDRWARLQSMSRSLAASALQSRMLTTVHRGDRPDQEQMLQSLDALITALEKERNRKHGS